MLISLNVLLMSFKRKKKSYYFCFLSTSKTKSNYVIFFWLFSYCIGHLSYFTFSLSFVIRFRFDSMVYLLHENCSIWKYVLLICFAGYYYFTISIRFNYNLWFTVIFNIILYFCTCLPIITAGFVLARRSMLLNKNKSQWCCLQPFCSSW